MHTISILRACLIEKVLCKNHIIILKKLFCVAGLAGSLAAIVTDRSSLSDSFLLRAWNRVFFVSFNNFLFRLAPKHEKK